MKIFLSYGHDSACHDIARRIKADLEALGHEVWFDKDRIEFGQQWRREITEGIHDSQQMVALLSAHSTRDPGVCRDEIAIALGAPGTGRSYVLCLLVQPEQEVCPPLSVSHLQWLDLHDWQDRQKSDPEGFEVWYRSQFKLIRKRLENPENIRFAGEIADLEAWLRPIDCTGDIIDRVQSFTGRTWLLDEIEAWRTGDPDKRMFWLTGGPGQGKSAVAAMLAHRSKLHVVAAQFCRFDRPERRDPAMVIRSIAFQLATRLPDYRKHLHDKPEMGELDRKNARELFDYLLADPLRYSVGGRPEPELVILDALDETLADGRSDLLDLVANELHRLPAWLKFLVSSRPEPAIRRQLEQFGVHEISADDDRNIADLRQYAGDWLMNLNLAAEQRELALEAVVSASCGNFLYLRRLEEAVTRGQIDLAHPELLPRGLSALYEQEFRQRFPDSGAYEREVVPLLEVVLASSRPIPIDELDNVLGMGKRQRARTLEKLGSLVPAGDQGVAVFHKSLRDWLCSELAAGADYFIEVPPGHRALGQALWERFAEPEHTHQSLSEYAIDEMPVQLAHWTNSELLKLHGSDPSGACLQRLAEVAQTAQDQCRWIRSESWWRLKLRLVELALGPEHPEVAENLIRLGALLAETANYAAAEPLYRRALDIQRQTLEPNHGAIAYTLDKLGQTLKEMALLDEANVFFQEALRIREARPDTDSEDMAASLNNLGELLDARGAFSEAATLYDRGFEILTRVSGNEGTGSAVFLNNLAILKLRLNGGLIFGRQAPTPQDCSAIAQAEELLRRAIAIYQRAFANSAHPDAARIGNNLAMCLQSSGQFRTAERTLRDALETCRSALGPFHIGTAICLNNLAALLDSVDSEQDPEPLYIDALAILEANFGSRRPESPHVARCLNNLATLVHARGDSAAGDLYQRALHIFTTVLGPSHCDTAQVLSNLALLRLEQGNLAASRAMVDGAFKARIDALGEMHPQTAVSQVHLGHLLFASGDNAAAARCFRAGLVGLEVWLGTGSIRLAPLLGKFAETLDSLGERAEAELLRCRIWDLVVHKPAFGDEPSDNPDKEQRMKLASAAASGSVIRRASPNLRMQLSVQESGFMHPLLNLVR